MKRLGIISIFVVGLAFTSCNNKEDATTKINHKNLEKATNRDAEIKKSTTSVKFSTSIYDFGIVNEGDIVETTFELTNSGKTDLVITNAKGSCGCTVPTWPKSPIKPGETGKIDVRFNTSGKPNKQRKTVTLTTNTESGREVLTIKGSVIPKSKK